MASGGVLLAVEADPRRNVDEGKGLTGLPSGEVLWKRRSFVPVFTDASGRRTRVHELASHIGFQFRTVVGF